MAVKVIGKYAPVIASSFLVGAAIFVLSFVVMDFVWTHFVVTDLQKPGIGDGVVVVGGDSSLDLCLAWQVWFLCFIDFGRVEPKNNQYLTAVLIAVLYPASCCSGLPSQLPGS
jgi:hypothetical protein